MDNNTIYVGIDISKEKHDICIKNGNGNVIKQIRIRNTKKELETLYTTVETLKDKAGNVFFGTMMCSGIPV
jgi:predicted NBD/HSP70 family sugar kinase